MRSFMQTSRTNSAAVVASEVPTRARYAGRICVLGAIVACLAIWSATFESGVGLADEKAKAASGYKPVAPVDVIMDRSETLITDEMEKHMYGKAKWSARKARKAALMLAELMNVTEHYSADYENPKQWQEMSRASRDLVLELVAAAKKKDEAKAKELVGAKGAIESGKIYKSCDACHKVYRD